MILMEKFRAMRSPSPKTNSTEPMKTVFSNGLWGILSWHIWTAISVSVSITLIYLNLTNYAIGGELGENAAATANILGALQLPIKAHELAIVSSLGSIAREWILGNLMDVNKGMLLGLVGAEGSLGEPSFLISGRYLAATQYALSSALWWRQSTPEETARKRGILKLAAFMCIGCILCALAGTASGALMIPRVDWFFRKTITLPIPFAWTNHYPNIMIDQRYGYGKYDPFYSQGPFGVQGFGNIDYFLKYWDDYASRRGLFLSVHQTELTHTASDFYGEMAINTSTTWGRMLGGNWTGSTTARTTMRDGNTAVLAALHKDLNGTTESDHYEAALDKWTARQYVADSGAVTVQAECHYRLKVPCVPSNSSYWCYTSRFQNGSVAIKSSQDLLLMGQGPTNTQYGLSIYITEGPRLTNYTDFASSLEVVIDEKYQNPGDLAMSTTPAVIVCSLSARVLSATISSADVVFTANIADYHEYQVLADGTHEPALPLIYHKHWLDSLDLIKRDDYLYDEGPLETATGNVTFSRRNSSRVTSNPALQQFAATLMPFNETINYARNLTWVNSTMEAAEIEVILGGAFAAILLFLPPCESQYMVPEGMKMPGTSMPQQHLYDLVHELNVQVYNQGYGFRLSTHTGRFAVALLCCHILIALWGSLWQLFRWKITAGWGTIPDYLALGLGSPLEQMGLDNTCAGISSKRTFQTIVRVGVRIPTHLEVAVLEPTALVSAVAVGEDVKLGEDVQSPLLMLEPAMVAVKYGSREKGSRRKEKLE